MSESLILLMVSLTSLGLHAGLWYQLGRMNQKIDLIYKNIDIKVKFKNDGPHKLY